MFVYYIVMFSIKGRSEGGSAANLKNDVGTSGTGRLRRAILGKSAEVSVKRFS